LVGFQWDLLATVDEAIVFMVVATGRCEFGLVGGGAEGEFGDDVEVDVFDVAVLFEQERFLDSGRCT
jgi:hypothetical protein